MIKDLVLPKDFYTYEMKVIPHRGTPVFHVSGYLKLKMERLFVQSRAGEPLQLGLSMHPSSATESRQEPYLPSTYALTPTEALKAYQDSVVADSTKAIGVAKDRINLEKNRIDTALRIKLEDLEISSYDKDWTDTCF